MKATPVTAPAWAFGRMRVRMSNTVPADGFDKYIRTRVRAMAPSSPAVAMRVSEGDRGRVVSAFMAFWWIGAERVGEGIFLIS